MQSTKRSGLVWVGGTGFGSAVQEEATAMLPNCLRTQESGVVAAAWRQTGDATAQQSEQLVF